MSRKYSVEELDDLREAVRHKYLYGSYRPTQQHGLMSRTFREDEMAKVVEEEIRTHMLAGHTAKELMS